MDAQPSQLTHFLAIFGAAEYNSNSYAATVISKAGLTEPSYPSCSLGIYPGFFNLIPDSHFGGHP